MKKLIICLLCIAFSCSSSKNISENSNRITRIDNAQFYGGDGSSFEKAIIIKAKTSSEGIAAEYNYLEKKYGRKNVDWQMIQQSLSYHNKKPFDILKIKHNNKEFDVYFEISSFFGKY